MPVTGVKVAVRIRPFNDREKKEGAALCVDMPGGGVVAIEDKGHETRFTYDHAYWSHDNSRPLATQETVYKDIGEAVLDNALEGYNYTLFAYGQTGSGKSYSMMGSSDEPGIIPRVGCALFERVAAAGSDGPTFEITCSFLEIYNEKLADLLVPRANQKELKIRQDPKTGIFVSNLSSQAVASYDQVSRLIALGDKNRTVASTNMNATSSRSHSVFTLVVTQRTELTNDAGESVGTHVKKAQITLVDLAGSERQDKTGATGDRLQEGININQSLTTLGRVIEALAYNATPAGQKKPQHVPYRDSQLTYLLQDALGGNAMTCMIAAISPASTNYDESLSTLKYADRAKQIKNTVSKNESAQERYIKELEDRVKELEAQLAAGGVLPSEGGEANSDDETASNSASRLDDVIEEYKRMLSDMSADYEERLKQTAEQSKALEDNLEKLGVMTETPKFAYLLSLNEDPLLSGALRYRIVDSETVGTDVFKTVFGSMLVENGEYNSSVVLAGKLGVDPQHFVILYHPDSTLYELVCISEDQPLFINGDYQLSDMEPITLNHGDFIRCGDGNGSFYAFVNPALLEEQPLSVASLYDQANEQFVNKNGILNPLNKLPIGSGAGPDSGANGPSSGSVEELTEKQQRKLEERERYLTVRRMMDDLFPVLCEAGQIARFFEVGMNFELDYMPGIAQGRHGYPEMSYDVGVTVLRRVYNPALRVHLEDTYRWSVEKFGCRLQAMRWAYSKAMELGDKQQALRALLDKIDTDPTCDLEYPFDNRTDIDQAVGSGEGATEDGYDSLTHFIGQAQINVSKLLSSHTISQQAMHIMNPYTNEVVGEAEISVTIPNPCQHDGFECEAFADRHIEPGLPCTLRFKFGRIYGVKPRYNSRVHALVHKPRFLGLANVDRPRRKLSLRQEDAFRKHLLNSGRAVSTPFALETSINPHLNNHVDLHIPLMTTVGADFLAKHPISISFYGFHTRVLHQIRRSPLYDIADNRLVIHQKDIMMVKTKNSTEERDGRAAKVCSEFIFVDINGLK
ncbi:Kinesin-3 [Giardia muris]|uniref:Kinesin-3 n=1 Tax=Giardia muris TaxID=5742 RepID=A0A4Z1T4X2_GIAMU|nr:Kinesin-3 [Giardia muris]|eukprot:TNJ27491.1 Kinesin-3 [Giardia muris]